MRRKSTIAWCRTSAPRRTSAGRYGAGLLEPALEPVHVAAGREGAALPGHDQRPQRGAVGEPGRRRDQLADQLGAHRVQHVGAVERQGADLAVDLEAEGLQLGRAGDGGSWSLVAPLVLQLASGASGA